MLKSAVLVSSWTSVESCSQVCCCRRLVISPFCSLTQYHAVLLLYCELGSYALGLGPICACMCIIKKTQKVCSIFNWNFISWMKQNQLTFIRKAWLLGYWHQKADERHGNPPPGNQELLVVKDKVGRPPSELGVSKSMECDIFHSVLWQCWLGNRKGIRPVKSLVLVCWWWFDWSFAQLVASVITTTSIILCFNKHGLTHFTWKMAIKMERERENKCLDILVQFGFFQLYLADLLGTVNKWWLCIMMLLLDC